LVKNKFRKDRLNELTDNLTDLRIAAKTQSRNFKIYEGENIEESVYNDNGLKNEGKKKLRPKAQVLDFILKEYKERHKLFERNPYLNTYFKLKRSKSVDVDRLFEKLFSY